MTYILVILMALISFFPEYTEIVMPFFVGIMALMASVFYFLVFKLLSGLNKSKLNIEDHNITNWQINLIFSAAIVVVYLQYSPFIAGIFIPLAIIGFCTNVFTELVKRGILEINDVDE